MASITRCDFRVFYSTTSNDTASGRTRPRSSAYCAENFTVTARRLAFYFVSVQHNLGLSQYNLSTERFDFRFLRHYVVRHGLRSDPGRMVGAAAVALKIFTASARPNRPLARTYAVSSVGPRNTRLAASRVACGASRHEARVLNCLERQSGKLTVSRSECPRVGS